MLVTCGECGSQVSNQAAQCPKCGAPASEFIKPTQTSEAIDPTDHRVDMGVYSARQTQNRTLLAGIATSVIGVIAAFMIPHAYIGNITAFVDRSMTNLFEISGGTYLDSVPVVAIIVIAFIITSFATTLLEQVLRFEISGVYGHEAKAFSAVMQEAKTNEPASYFLELKGNTSPSWQSDKEGSLEGTKFYFSWSNSHLFLLVLVASMIIGFLSGLAQNLL